MGYYETVILPSDKFHKLHTIEDLYNILTSDETTFLHKNYPDLTLEDGFLELTDYTIKCTDQSLWISILQKLSILENELLEILFFSDFGNAVGFRAYPNGTVKSLRSILEEEKTVSESEDKKKFSVIVNLNVEYIVHADNEEEAKIEAQNIELPKGYLSDSFEIVKINKNKS